MSLSTSFFLSDGQLAEQLWEPQRKGFFHTHLLFLFGRETAPAHHGKLASPRSTCSASQPSDHWGRRRRHLEDLPYRQWGRWKQARSQEDGWSHAPQWLGRKLGSCHVLHTSAGFASLASPLLPLSLPTRHTEAGRMEHGMWGKLPGMGRVLANPNINQDKAWRPR